MLNCGADTLPVRTLIPASILELIRYDRTHDTSYYKTLLNYIEFDSHTAKAIDDLYIHRNTFKSRMKRSGSFWIWIWIPLRRGFI